MQTARTLKALASSAAANAAIALALGLSLSPAAYAGDFDDGYPLFSNTQAQQQPAPQGIVITAAKPPRAADGRVSTEESRAMLREDSGSFWMTQHQARKPNTTVARADTIRR